MRGTTSSASTAWLASSISIHVPREGDDGPKSSPGQKGAISIHVPREGDDSVASYRTFSYVAFQSTSPVRGTTQSIPDYINSHKISIHVPREGDDGTCVLTVDVVKNFNPRPP